MVLWNPYRQFQAARASYRQMVARACWAPPNMVTVVDVSENTVTISFEFFDADGNRVQLWDLYDDGAT